MLEYYLQEGVEGKANLKQLYAKLNFEYFEGVSLPRIKLQWSGRLKKAIGRASVEFYGIKKRRSKLDKLLSEIPVRDDIEIDKSSLLIQMSKSFDLNLNDVKAVMLHEMVHILLYTQKKVGTHHGTPEFDGWIRKLRDKSGLDIPFNESSFKKSPSLKAKEGIAFLITGSQGKFGFTHFSKNAINKKWLVMAGNYTRAVVLSPNMNRIEGFKVKHPIISADAPKRSFNKLSWKWIDEETAKQIRRTGKRFFEADKDGSWIKPSTAGIPEKGVFKLDKYGDIEDVVSGGESKIYK